MSGPATPWVSVGMSVNIAILALICLGTTPSGAILLWTGSANEADGMLAEAASADVGQLVTVDNVSQPVALCLPQASNTAWLRLLLRISKKSNWDNVRDRVVNAAAIQDLSVVKDKYEEFFANHGHRFVKGAVVRDPVTRVLSGYLELCRTDGQWSKCLSTTGPISFSDMVRNLETARLDRVDPLFRRQVDMCGLRDRSNFDVVVKHETPATTAEEFLRRANLWESYGHTGWGELDDASFRDILPDDEDVGKVCDMYTPQTLQSVKNLYKEDFETFAYDVERWDRLCAQPWQAKSQSGAINTSALYRLPSASKELEGAYDGATGCAASKPELESLVRWKATSADGMNISAAGNSFKFYIHQDGKFDFSGVLDCLMRRYGLHGDTDDWDDRVLANVSEHLGEVWLLRALRKHPQRTDNPAEANLHVIGALPFVSYAASWKFEIGEQCGTYQDHERRMTAVKEALLGLPAFQKSNGRNFFIFTTHFRIPELYTRSLLKLLNRGNIIVGTADMDYTHWKLCPTIKRKVVLPYKAHYIVEDSAFSDSDDPERDIDFLFRGKMGRMNSGSGRQELFRIGQGMQRSMDIRDIFFFRRKPEFSDELANAYLRSRFCFVPAGDSPTSRRLFDALAAGCIPVNLGNFDRLVRNLPFKSTIDWTKIVLFGGSLQCMVQDLPKTTSWLSDLSSDDSKTTLAQTILEMSDAGREVFQGALSYARNGEGLVTALLQELAQLL